MFWMEAVVAHHLGGPCLRTSAGLLGRRQVRVTLIRHIGKESNRLDEVEDGLVGDLDDVQIQYVAEWEAALPKLKEIYVPRLTQRTGLSRRTLRSNLNSGRLPRREYRRRLIALVAQSGSRRHPVDTIVGGLAAGIWSECSVCFTLRTRVCRLAIN